MLHGWWGGGAGRCRLRFSITETGYTRGVKKRSITSLATRAGRCVSASMQHQLDLTSASTFSPRRMIVDRKSGVSGKSVSVRVDLGGRRIFKKKIHKKIIRLIGKV